MRPSTANVLAKGLIAGAIGFGVTALGFVVLDLATGQALGFTPSLLAASLFHGVTNVCDVQPAIEPMLAYSALHLVTFLALGCLTAWLFSLTARRPQLYLAALFMFLFVAFHLFGAVASILAPVSGCFSLYHVFGATTAAAVTMILYLLREHRGLVSELARSENA